MENKLTPELKERLEEIAKKYITPCTCGEMYASRSLEAPDCFWHNEIEGVVEAMSAAYHLDRSESTIDILSQAYCDCQQALAKSVGILQNIRHEIDYLPDSYYEWIDKVINEVDEHLPYNELPLDTPLIDKP